MNPKVSKLVSKYSEDLPETIQQSICEEINSLQRSFKWNEWEFGFTIIERPNLLIHLDTANLLRLIVLLTEHNRTNSGFFVQLLRSGFVGKIFKYLKKHITVLFHSNENPLIVDPTFDFRADTAPNRDPDQHSRTLKLYHKLLWQKELPCGRLLELSENKQGKYLYHNSELGEFNLTSDCITHTYRNTARMKNIIAEVPNLELEHFFNSCFEIGGYTLFPGGKKVGFQTINQARGCNRKIADRFDLTLECFRRHYANLSNPLENTIRGYREFFELFGDFQSYVEFFHLQDLVSPNFAEIKFHLPFDGTFPSNPFPNNLSEYQRYSENTLSFMKKRTNRILNNLNVVNLRQ